MISTYELGRQPIHVASPAGRLHSAGHQVQSLDLAVEAFDPARVDWADGIAISVPMHTAMVLGMGAARRIRSSRPDVPLVMYGLYAAMAGDSMVGDLVDAAYIGEYEPALLAWAGDPSSRSGTRTDLGIDSFTIPARNILPPLEAYAHLVVGGEHRLVGAVEASHGCRHRCRHCPIPAVYDGLFRIVGIEPLLGDVQQLVDAGARHITFADPDFLNGPAHSRRVLDAVHAEFPTLTFDVTVKVEHILTHAYLIDELVEKGVLFAVSAFETTNDQILGRLDKGHTASDLEKVMRVTSQAGLDLHPSWLPFTPWTTVDDVVEIFRFLDRHDLFDVTPPVQMAIRLLVPEGSLILSMRDHLACIGPYDPESLTYPWQSKDAAVDALQQRLAQMASLDADADVETSSTLVAMWEESLRAAGAPVDEAQIPAGAVSGRPNMTEPWFC